jgi:hypothetical protein
VTLLFCNIAMAEDAPQRISLAGEWRFALDREDAGISGQWFNRALPDSIKLPGSLQEQGYGDEPSADTKWTSGIGGALLAREKYAPYRTPGDFKTPFWLTPKRHYVGAAWYQRDVDVPETWKDKRVVLHLERAHWETTVWMDAAKAGMQNSLGTPHDYDLSKFISPGRHRLTIRVDNSVKIPVGLDAHSVSDQTQTNWNGIIGDIALRETNPLFIDDLQVYPDVSGHKVRVRFVGAGPRLTVRAAKYNAGDPRELPPKDIPINPQKSSVVNEFDYDLGGDALTWDEFSPALYRMTAELKDNDGKLLDRRQVSFGQREISTSGTRFMLNGHPIQFRGTLECCIFPLTGYPPTDVESWKRILRIAREHGLNHIRFHSWCPPEAAFVAGDEMGFYYQVECCCWAHFGKSPVDQWVTEEAERIQRAYGNHPSFVMLVPSNEANRTDPDGFLAKLISSWDTRQLHAAGSGWPVTPANQYDIEQYTRLHQSHELERPPQTSADYRDFVAKQTVPSIVHEMGQWCVYPNFDEIPKYTGSLRPGNLEIFRDFLNKSGMGGQFHDFFMASGKFQTILYKTEIEEVLRTPGMGGFQLLDLHDFPGQGTAPVGVLDAFWDSKGYVTPEEYRRFCNQTVLLARLPKRVFTTDETAHIDVDVSHFGPADLHDPRLRWRVRDASGKVVLTAIDALGPELIPTGRLSHLCSIEIHLANLPAPAKLNFEVSLDGTPFANDWDFWIYPAKVSTTAPADIVIAREFDSATQSALEAGKKVLLLLPAQRIASDTHGAFEPIFWNRITFPAQKNHTLGIFCHPEHAALKEFPTDAHSNWQWWDLQQHCKPMILDALPKELAPVVQMIDDWDMCRKLGLVIEGRVGRGSLVVCSIDLESDLDQRLAARQLRRSLLDYMASASFSPATELTAAQIQSLLRQPTAMEKLGARIVDVDSEQPGHEAANILDGNPATLWHTSWENGAPPFPHHVSIAFESPATLAGVRLLPRQDGNSNGWIKGYEIYAGNDGKNWGAAVARGVFEKDAQPKDVRFGSAVTCRYLKIVATAGFGDAPYASLADVELIAK